MKLVAELTIVVLAYNSVHTLSAALSSTENQEFVSDVIVIDNGSVDGSDLVARRHGEVVSLGQNMGYAVGMNVGFRLVESEYVCFMNADALLHPNFARNATAILDRRTDLAGIAPLVVRWTGDPSQQPWDLEGSLPIDGGPLNVTKLMRVAHGGDPARGRPVVKANGACPVYRRSSLMEICNSYGVGPFDPVFDTYGEDIDLALKMWRSGKQIHYCPSVIAAHVRSASSSESVRDKRGRLRSNVLSARHVNATRHLPRREVVAAVPVLLVQDVGLVAAALACGDRGVTRDVRRGWGQAIAEVARRSLRLRGEGWKSKRPSEGFSGWRVRRRSEEISAADLRRMSEPVPFAENARDSWSSG